MYGAAPNVDGLSVTTKAATEITDVSAVMRGSLTAEGGAVATRLGFCYIEGSAGTPTITDRTAYADGSFISGPYTDTLSDLHPGSYYQVRAYATNADGTVYGAILQILTTGTPTVVTILTHATLLAGAETALTDCSEHTDLSRVTSMSLHVEMTFEASVDADPTVSVFASTENDNDEYDTTAWKTWTLPRSAGNTVTLHWPYSDEIRPLPKYIKTKVKNNSGAGADTSITSITIRKEVKEL